MQRQIAAAFLQVRENIVNLLKLGNIPEIFVQLYKQLKKEGFLVL